ncbi:MAG: hypothetical protein KJT03_15470, partial [Verrucomicrobiae bacterium]|nr:hypothetical protein [Verrucomicrobiae bacterium]
MISRVGGCAMSLSWTIGCFCLLLGLVRPASALILEDVEPAFGQAGSSVQLKLDGINLEAQYSVKIGDQAAAVTEVTAEGLIITLPVSVETGILEIQELP